MNRNLRSYRPSLEMLEHRELMSTGSTLMKNSPPVLDKIANQVMDHHQDLITVPVVTHDADGDVVALTARVRGSSASTPRATVAVQGDQLVIDPRVDFVGKFYVEVTASDGLSSAKRTFKVAVKNARPQLDKITNMTDSGAVTFTARDADQDLLTYSALIKGRHAQPPATLTVQGNQLFIEPIPSFTGTFVVVAKVADGIASASRAFRVSYTSMRLDNSSVDENVAGSTDRQDYRGEAR